MSPARCICLNTKIYLNQDTVEVLKTCKKKKEHHPCRIDDLMMLDTCSKISARSKGAFAPT